MFKLFSKDKRPVAPMIVEEPRVTTLDRPKKSNKLVEEIHQAFYQEVNKLLAEASISKSTDTTKQDLIDKCRKLKMLGFTSTKEVLEAQAEINRLNAIERENKANQKLVDAINYYSQKYPQYKFITEDSVKKICAKYGLVYSTVNRFIGIVPDENLTHIENFKIK
jgi:hypothetical protein